ncbi:MAG TPA: DMT family transporter [Xanthobacteraceae bacterium]|nr:DMT family transporter [Xanthobacteraceae bacterium]
MNGNHLPDERSQRLYGIGLMCAAVAMFACLDTSAKFLGGHIPTLEVVWGRYLAGLAFVLPWANPITKPGLMRTRRPVLQIVRALCLLGSTFFNFLSLRYLQLDEALAIMFSAPFLVVLAAGPILGEWVGWRRLLAVSIGFTGILIVTRPGMGGIHPAALLTLAAAICMVFYSIMTRMLARSDANDTTWFYTNAVGAAVMTLVVPFVWVTPDWWLVPIMIASGALGSFGHRLLIMAHRLAPAPVLSPFTYSQIIWVVMLGYVVFGDIPNAWTLTGSAVVILAGLYLIQQERRFGLPRR